MHETGTTLVDTKQLGTSYADSVAASGLWNGSGLTGKGIGVAVIDTGIAGDLPDFRVSASDAASRVVATVVTNPSATTPNDTYGHGTHVAGILAGNGGDRPAGDPLRGRYIGVAPDASLVSVKAADDDGIVVVAAAGNRGTAADAVDYAPGNDPYAISVGGADDRGTKGTADDDSTTWGSIGTTQDGYAKPEVIAPGAHIVSTLAPGSAFARLCPACVRDGSYFQAGGTSMSTPVVSGVVALLLQKHPDWTPDRVKGALMKTARPLTGGRTNLREIVANKALTASATANAGLVPNTCIDAATGGIDYTKASWSKASWSSAGDLLKASWSKASWSCACDATGYGGVDPAKASWSKASWSTSWNK